MLATLYPQPATLKRPPNGQPHRGIVQRGLVGDFLVADEKRLRAETAADIEGLLRAEQPVVIDHHANRRAARACLLTRRMIDRGGACDTDAAAEGESLKGPAVRVIAELQIAREVGDVAI